MSEINIERPINLKMSLIESEDILPSIKLRVEIVIINLLNKSTYEANDMWFKSTDWDKFSADLLRVNNNGSATFDKHG